MKDTTWSTVRVSPLVAVARGMLRLRIKTTPRSVFSSSAHFSQLAISEIVQELLEADLVKKGYTLDSEVVIFRKKDNVQTDSFHFSVRIQSLQADKTVQWEQNWLTQLVFHRAHTYRRRSSAVEYSRCLVKIFRIGQKRQKHSWNLVLRTKPSPGGCGRQLVLNVAAIQVYNWSGLSKYSGVS